ncbi:LamG domain-containing protein [bacterium]|nr:LamG domain-containing protein [bacterium]
MAIDTVQFCYGDGVSSPDEVCQTAQSLVFDPGAPDLLTGLAAWWALEESSGTRYNSHEISSPADYPLTEGLAAGNATGKIGNAWNPGGNSPTGAYLSFDGTASSPMPDIMTAESMSVCLWVNFNNIADPPDSTASQFLFHRGDLTTLQSGEFQIYLNKNSSTSPNQMQFDILTVGPGRNRLTGYTSIIPTPGAWYFVFAYYDNATGDQGISVNGGTWAENFGDVNPVPGNDGVIQLGQFKSNNPTYYYRLDGKLDEVGVWANRVLTTDEVTWLYNSGSGRAYADLGA